MVLVDHQRLLGCRLWQRLSGGIVCLSLRLDQFQCFVVLDFLVNPLFQSNQWKLQDLHRLDHAGRKHLLLRHPHFLTEGHPHRHR